MSRHNTIMRFHFCSERNRMTLEVSEEECGIIWCTFEWEGLRINFMETRVRLKTLVESNAIINARDNNAWNQDKSWWWWSVTGSGYMCILKVELTANGENVACGKKKTAFGLSYWRMELSNFDMRSYK